MSISDSRKFWLLASQPRNWLTLLGLALLRALCHLPFPYNVRVGKILGLLLYLLPSKRRQITNINLQLCFPDKSSQEREALCKEVFENYGAGLIETGMAWWWNPESFYSLATIEGLEEYQAARNAEKGMVILGAHFSTLDLGAALAHKWFSFSVSFKPNKNELFNHVMAMGRKRHTLHNLETTELRQMVRVLREGGLVWIAPDQDMGEAHSVYAQFFGHTAATITTVGKLARLGNAGLAMFTHHRHADDSGYRVSISVPEKNFPSGDDLADANRINRMLEDAIRVDPGQYYWLHRRFKTQPGLARGAIYDA